MIQTVELTDRMDAIELSEPFPGPDSPPSEQANPDMPTNGQTWVQRVLDRIKSGSLPNERDRAFISMLCRAATQRSGDKTWEMTIPGVTAYWLDSNASLASEGAKHLLARACVADGQSFREVYAAVVKQEETAYISKLFDERSGDLPAKEEGNQNAPLINVARPIDEYEF